MFRWCRQITLWVLGFCLFFWGCSIHSKDYKIGRDSTWYPKNFGEKTPYVNLFINNLTAVFTKKEHLHLELIDVSWNVLMEGLTDDEYDGVLTTLPLRIPNTDRYVFSDPILLLGPVLVLPVNSKAKTLNDLQGKILGICQFNNSVLLAQKYSPIIKAYDSDMAALEDLANGNLDGILIGNLQAHSLVPTRFAGQLWIATQPLTDEAIRLVTLKGKGNSLISRFNNALKKVQKAGTFNQLKNQLLDNPT